MLVLSTYIFIICVLFLPFPIILKANLFKLQLGGTRHWNVYVHSYLYTGINGAWSRINAHAHWKSNDLNPCLPIGKELEFTSWVHINEKNQFLPRSDPKSTQYTAMMVNNATEYDHEACSLATYALLRKETNEEWCDFQMDGNCGFAGIYQPPVSAKTRIFNLITLIILFFINLHNTFSFCFLSSLILSPILLIDSKYIDAKS